MSRLVAGELANSQQRQAQLESLLRGKDKEVDRLSKQVEAARAEEYEVTAVKLQAEEAALRLEGEMAATRQRQAQLEGLVRSKDKELDKLAKQLESAKGAHADVGLTKEKAEEGGCGLMLGECRVGVYVRVYKAEFDLASPPHSHLP